MKLHKKFAAFLLITISIYSPSMIYGQTISPYLIGNNAWYDGSLSNLWSKMGTAKFQAIRIGGAGAEGYGTNYTKYTTLIDGIRSANCEPILQVPRYLSSQQAIDFITYINKTMGKKIKYWIIGNEPNMTAGYSNEAAVANYTRTIASALKSVDPTIITIGPELSYYDPAYVNLLTPGHADDITGKDAAGNYYIDIYTWHKYGFTSITGIEDNVNSVLSKLSAANALRPTGQKIGWALTEINTTYDNDQNTLGDDQFVWSFRAGQLYAELYGMGMRKGAFTMDFWSMFEGSIEHRGTDLSLFDKDYTPRSNYYHSMMLGQNMKKNYITSSDNQSNITVIPMQDETGTAVMVLNNDRYNGFDYTLRLTTASNAIQSNSLNMYVNAGIATEIYGYIPSASTQMLVFDTQGTLIKRYVYTANDAAARRAPTVQTSFCNNPPSVSVVPKQYKAIDKGQFTVNLYGINDADKWTQGVTITATSSNPSIVSVDALNYTANNTTGSLSLTPKADGTATITITVTENPHSCTPLTTTSTFVVRSFNPIPIPSKVEAENYIDMYGVKNVNFTVGTGTYVGYLDKYDNIDLGVRVPKTGTYTANFNLASASTSTTAPAFKLMNGVASNSSTLASITVAVTGGWEIWNTQTATVNLTAGDQILRLLVTASGFNINNIEFIDPSNTAVSEINSQSNVVNICQSVNQVTFDITDITSKHKVKVLSIYNSIGKIIFKQTNTTNQLTLNKSQFQNGVYIAKCEFENGSAVRKFSIRK